MAGLFNKVLDFIGIEEEEDSQVEETTESESEYEDDYEEQPARTSRRRGKITSIAPAANRLVVYQPTNCDDSLNIIDNLKSGRPVVMNLEAMDLDASQRVLDFVVGAVYALSGNIHKVTHCIFLITPINVDVTGNIPDELKGKTFFNLGGHRG